MVFVVLINGLTYLQVMCRKHNQRTSEHGVYVDLDLADLCFLVMLK